MTNSLLLASATEIARLIRNGSLTSREVVEAHIAQIKKVNPALNAMVAPRFAQACEEADAADRRTKETGPERLPIFHGVPCSIKEAFALTGMPQTSGLVARKGFTAREDAPAVTRLREAGAIPLGVTNLSELCMWMESNNRVYGRTNNPYDPSRIVGGSSGGEGAIVGAGGAPFGLGSDIGGSIRMPAFFNGVFGHKPTGGLIPVRGHYPMSDHGGHRYVTTGPLCRRACDLMPLVKILAGPDPGDPEILSLKLGSPESVQLGELTVLSVPDDGGVHPVSEDLRASQGSVEEALRGLGATVQRTHVPGLSQAFEIWSAMLAAVGGTTFGTLLGNGRPISLMSELLRWPFRRSPHTLPAIALAALERWYTKDPAWVRRYVGFGTALKEELLEKIGPNGVLLYPSHTRPAPRHYRPIFSRFNWVYTAIFNVMEFPVTQVPLGLNRQGLPLGIQVVATPGNDHLTIRIAMELEGTFGGWVPPFDA